MKRATNRQRAGPNLGYLSKDAICNKVVEPHNIFSLIYTQILSVSLVVHLVHNLLAGFETHC
jgi:hypothetical protein